MTQIDNTSRLSSCNIVRYIAEPVAIASAGTLMAQRGFARCVSAIMGVCGDYLGPDIEMIKMAGTYPVDPLVQKKVADAAEKQGRSELKKAKSKRQISEEIFVDKKALDRLAQALKLFIKAAQSIELKGGQVKLDAQQLMQYLHMGRKDFPEDSLLASLSRKLSAENENISAAHDVTEHYIKIKQSGKLPTPTQRALQIFRLANDDNVDTAELAEVVKTDPAIVARILKIANSAFYKSLQPTRSVQDAIVRLGLKMLKKISLGVSLISHNKKGPCIEFDYEMFWSESLARAIAVSNVNYAKNHIFDADEMFTVGLLCQIGRLAFATAYPEEYAQILRQVDDADPAGLCEEERKVFGFDHNELTAEMMSDWHLPDVFCKAVCFQDSVDDQNHLPPGSPEYELACILHLPVKISRILTQSSIKLGFLRTFIEEADRLGLGTDYLDQNFDKIAREWQDMGITLDVKTRQVMPWKEIYAQIK